MVLYGFLSRFIVHIKDYRQLNKQIEDSKINNNKVKIYALILCHISYFKKKTKPSTHMKISMAHEEPVTNTLNL